MMKRVRGATLIVKQGFKPRGPGSLSSRKPCAASGLAWPGLSSGQPRDVNQVVYKTPLKL